MKGSRVQAIIRELHGEKIDIIAYSDDPSQFAMNALSPAKISRANVIDPLEKHLEGHCRNRSAVPGDWRMRQNEAAAKSRAGRSTLKRRRNAGTESKWRSYRAHLSELPGLTAALLQKLTDSGVETIEQLADTPIAELTNIKGVGPKSAEKIIESVKEYYTRQSEEPASEASAADSVVAPAAEQSPRR
jgi:N utilization substance protein A